MRGKQQLPAQPCDNPACDQLLPSIRHPKTLYCSTACREACRWQRDHIRNRPAIKCLDYGLSFIKIGAHAVQKHGYDSARDYRLAHGLNPKRGITTEEHRARLEENARENGTINNLEKGAGFRFKKGDGRASGIVKNYQRYKKTGVWEDKR